MAQRAEGGRNGPNKGTKGLRVATCLGLAQAASLSWRERARETFDHAWIPAKTFFQFGAILYATKTYVVDVTMCLGPSMLPTFNQAGDIVLVDALASWLPAWLPAGWKRGIGVGDVVNGWTTKMM